MLTVLALVVGMAAEGALPVSAGAARPATTATCDPIATSLCLLPFPDDFYTVADADSPTGRRLHLPVAAMPLNISGVPIDPSETNRSDGFSPGSMVMAFVPGIDLGATGAAPITDIGRSLVPDAPIVLLDTVTRQRVPYWVELDTWNPDAATKALVIRPARDFVEGHHCVVVLRDLKDSTGHVLPAPAAFTVLRDHRHTKDPALNARRSSMKRAFADLARGHLRRKDLYLAWDFTVASSQGLAGRMLKMRDDAYAALGGGVPSFQVQHVDDNVSADVLRRVTGTFDVPVYLTGNGGPGSRLVLGADGLPVRNGTYQAEFRCLVPHSVVGPTGTAQPARGVVYGHGLLGGAAEIEGFAPFINQYRVVLCATPEIGLASGDVPNVLEVIQDFSNFGSIPDRLQQGILNMQFLARLLKDPRGFGNHAAFRVGTPTASSITPGQVFFNGNSQGGILGGAMTAVSKEWTRAVLGVPGMNYSELLPRSVDFDPFLPLVRASYPDKRQTTLIVALNQILWDRGDADGYAQHLTTHPYPGTPTHQVLMIEAFGDHQVANIATETEARTIGAFVREPVIKPGRSNDVVPFWGITPLPFSPFPGSVLELWDFGTPAPPTASVPPESPTYGSDPHGAARRVPTVGDQVSQFLQEDGRFVDECGPGPCVFP